MCLLALVLASGAALGKKKPVPGKAGPANAYPLPSLAAPPPPPPAPAVAAGPQRVALLELAALGLSEGLRKNLELLLSNSIRTMKGMLLIPPLDVQMILQSPKNSDLAVCGGGPECALRIGQAAGADVVVFGTLAAIGESFNVNLRALRVR